jgi:peptidoglycan/LPS O-acetylase OafA/YrhL
VCGTALVIWTGECQVSHGPTYFLSRDPLVYLGDISYSLYLFHFAWLALPLELSSPWNFDGAPTIETMAAIAMAAVSYRFIEQPFRQAQWLRNDPLAALLFAACCGALVWDVSIWVA